MRGINGESATGSMSGNYSLCDQMLVGNEGSMWQTSAGQWLLASQPKFRWVL